MAERAGLQESHQQSGTCVRLEITKAIGIDDFSRLPPPKVEN
jgi:hypothetical protein